MWGTLRLFKSAMLQVIDIEEEEEQVNAMLDDEKLGTFVSICPFSPIFPLSQKSLNFRHFRG